MKKRLLVLALFDGFPFGGDENRMLQIAQGIDRERFDLRVATIRPHDPHFESQVGNIRPKFEEAGFSIVDLSVPRRTRGLGPNDIRRHLWRVQSLVATIGRVVGYVRAEGVDVIDGHHPAGYLTGALAGAITGIPSIVTTYNVSERWQPRQVWRFVHGRTLAASRAVVTDSKPVARELQSWLPAAQSARVRIIPNGPPPPAARRSEAEVRRMLGLRPRGATRVVAQIAALSRGKGQHIVLDAAPRVLEQHPDVTFLLCGFERPVPGYADVLRARARELGISDRVIVTSYPGDIGDVWQVVDVQVHPTRQDSLPNTILEGMSLGKPMVVSAHAGIPDLVTDGHTGIVVPVDDAAAVATSLLRLLDAPATAQALGSAARERYVGAYTPEHLVRSMQELFVEVATTRAR